MYKHIKELLALVWKDDDHMTQETLFEVQDKVADFALAVAQHIGQEKDLLATFPWVFEEKEQKHE